MLRLVNLFGGSHVGACRSDVTLPMSPVREASKDLSSHPLPPSPGGSPYWWDLPQDTLWPEEDAQSEFNPENRTSWSTAQFSQLAHTV